jgi:hypothetical protein
VAEIAATVAFDEHTRRNDAPGCGDRPRTRERPDEYIYVIAGAAGLVKIGRSKDPAKRLVDLQGASGIRLMLAYVSDGTKRAADMERAAHRRLHAERRIGEWFETTVEEAIAAILACKDAPAMTAAVRATTNSALRRCQSCGVDFPAMRGDRRFCGDTCRKRDRRKRIREAAFRGHLRTSVSHEWHTEAPIVAAARQVLGGIDLDPASCAEAQETVRAARFFTKEQDGLTRPWAGRVFMNRSGSAAEISPIR